MANMKGLRSDAGAAVLGESIYVCGGYCYACTAAALATIGYTLPQSTCERYDPAANTWTLVANLPEARSYLLDQLVAYEGHLYTCAASYCALPPRAPRRPAAAVSGLELRAA